ncbi:immunoglobulin kappa light chain-like isoform X4 [Myxocyprinus asiaticus]|uniref:immunoglobulin kappa light chain-like isoform X4 n=1 Tax=Myxocyprinus asiaticus TaxID=70543 RepID=UPI002222EC82|nr:immunoglobulin kappa light chain-like isoform X4 [Myxocyprinus asiaticus]
MLIIFYTLLTVLSSLFYSTAHLYTQHTPNHKMMTIFCTFCTLLTCVSGVTVVTQNPSVLTVNKGQKVTLNCNMGTVINSARWYKQTPGGVPQYVLNFQHDWSSVIYGSGFSAPKFTSTHSSKSDYSLIINNVEVGDSAVYYCKTWDNSAKELVFGQGTKLMVSDSAVPPPVVNILPSSEDQSSSKITLVCLINDMPMGFADVRWLVNGISVTDGVFTSSAEQQPNEKFKMSSYFTTESSEWEKDKDLTCEVTVGSRATARNIKKSQCSD